jgi:hypothetical protein
MTWTLTPRQAEILTATIETGSIKGAAVALGVSYHYARVTTNQARQATPFTSNLALLLHWDRLLRVHAELPIRTERARAVLPDGTPVMDALRQACRKAGGARLTEIRKATGLTGKGASDRLDKLIAAGHVSRTENPPRYYLKGQR